MNQILADAEKFEVRKYAGVLLLFAAVVCLGGLGSREIFSGDETRVAGISAEMIITGDFVTPRLGAEPFLEYPPFYYYLTAASFEVFGFTDFAALLPSALAGIASTLLIFALGLRLGMSRFASFLGAIMLITGAQFFSNARTCMVDSWLAFFVLLALYGAATMFFDDRKKVRMAGFWLYAAGLGGGVFTKGLIGLAMPGAALGVFLLLDDWHHRKFQYQRYLWLALGVLPALIPVAVWCRLLYLDQGNEALHTVLWVNNFGRFSGSQGDHLSPFYYYLTKLPGQFMPYLFLLPFGIWYSWKAKDGCGRFLLTFLLVPYLLLTLASSKRQVYLLPLYAPAALLAARYLVTLLDAGKPWVAMVLRRGFLVLGGLIAAAALAAAVIPGGKAHFFPIMACVLAIAALAGRRDPVRRLWALLFSYAFLFASIDGAVLSRQNRKESLREAFAICGKSELPVYLINPPERTRGAAYFYLGRALPIKTADEYDGVARELWLVRDKRSKVGIKVGDDHRILTMPGDRGTATK